MRRLAFVTLVACGSPSSSQVSHPAATPAPSPSTTACTTTSVVVPDANRERRAQLAKDLLELDRELDAIDAELSLAAQLSGLDLIEARIKAIELRAQLDKVSVDLAAGPPDLPIALAKALRDVRLALSERAKLATDLGDRHPRMEESKRRIEFLADVATQALKAERELAVAWGKELAKLPATAKPERVYKARLIARRDLLKQGVVADPSASLRVAAERLREALWNRQELSRVLGPKHPDAVAADALVDARTADAASAMGAEATDLTLQIDAAPRAPDPSLIARRGQLAERARDLRREYELLVPAP
jgi:hypothetical protein